MTPTLTPQALVARWRSVTLYERGRAQEHFVEFCRRLGPSMPIAADLRRRTLVNHYNASPVWLDLAHQKLDAAVWATHGWPAGVTDGRTLDRLHSPRLARANSPQPIGQR